MERIKINNKEYKLIPDGIRLTDQGGQVLFQPGDAPFETVKADLEAARELTVLDDLGSPIISRSDLIYAGRLTLDDRHIIRTELVQAGVGDAGDPIYETKDITGPVMIAEFRTPDLRDQVAALEAQLAYVAMMSNVDMEV